MSNITIAMRCRNEIALLPWSLSNLTYASEIFISDQQSDDGTYEYILSLSMVDKRIHLESFKFDGWFVHQADHLRSLMSFVQRESKGFDYFQCLDIDDIPNIKMQNEIKDFKVVPNKKLSLGIKYLYLTPDGLHYYGELSKNPEWRFLNYLPEVFGKDSGGPLFYFDYPDEMILAPEGWYITHWNWCCLNRFEDKLKRYVGSPAAFGQPTWRPEDKFNDPIKLPDEIKWYGLSGKIITPKEMKALNL